ncbi:MULTISPECIES: SHOCT domain-containing protein [Gemmiger]|uniref:SHOCT domain-containing protein n=1 Tax=Gemmiger TaxID=204475 RepID=UPI002F404ECD
MPAAIRFAPFLCYGKGEFSLKKDNLIRYSMQLAFLKQLLEKKLISDREYSLIKNRLMKDYKIVSDLLS